MPGTSTDTRQRAVRVIVSQKLGGRLISAVALGGGYSNAGLYRARTIVGLATRAAAVVVP
jgi:hypothetical protein